MPRYIVIKKEIWNQGVQVEADSKEEAIRKVVKGEGEMIETLFEFSVLLSPDNWNVEPWEFTTSGTPRSRIGREEMR
jgi:hypothetical protein